MKFYIETDYLGPIELGPHQWVTVVLPDGRHVTVFADNIYVATEQDVFAHKDGKRIWDAMSAARSPYGKTVSA